MCAYDSVCDYFGMKGVVGGIGCMLPTSSLEARGWRARLAAICTKLHTHTHLQDSPHCNVMDDFDLTRCYEVLTGCSLSNCCGHTGTHEKLLHQMQRAVQWINSQVVKNQVHISFSNKQLKVTYSHMNYVNSLILVHKCINVHL